MHLRNKSVVYLLFLMLTLMVMISISTETATSSFITPKQTMKPVQEKIVFLDAAQQVIDAEQVRVICFTTQTGVPFSDFWLTLNNDGTPQDPLPPNCNYIAAMRLLHTQPSGNPDHGPAYWIYATSWTAGEDTPQPLAETIVIPDDQTLVLFNVVASLAWEPAADSPFESQLRDGLKQASAYLYDVSEGQMALGPLTIYNNGQNWNQADLRFLTANDARPWAFVGGILPERTAYTSPQTGRSSRFGNGATFYGRFWDGSDAFDSNAGSWDQQDAYRTIIHEWSHYALFLYDEYRNTFADETHCTGIDNRDESKDKTNASIMDYQYTASEFWSGRVHGFPTGCQNTIQFEVHGEDDWTTLSHWHWIQQLPTSVDPPIITPIALEEGPNLGLTAALFGREPGHFLYLPIIRKAGTWTAPTTDLREPKIDVFIDEGFDFGAAFASQVYLLEDTAVSLFPRRIHHQGRPVFGPEPENYIGSMTILNVNDTDRLHVSVQRSPTDEQPGELYTYAPKYWPPDSEIEPIHDGFEVVAVQDPWHTILDLQPNPEKPRQELTVIFQSLTHSNLPTPIAHLCAIDANSGCAEDAAWLQEMTPIGSDIWQATFTPLPAAEELPLYGIVRIEVPEFGERIRWFRQAGGVGPAHEDADAPTQDGDVMVDAVQDIPSGISQAGDCSHVLIMPSANDTLLRQLLPQDVKGIIGMPLDIDVLQPHPDGEGCIGLEPGSLPTPVVVTLFYSAETLEQLGVARDQLRVLHYFQSNGEWVDVTTEVPPNPDQLNGNNWISSFPLNEGGFYAIGWRE